MNATLTPPIFIIDAGVTLFPLIYVAATKQDLDVFLIEHKAAEQLHREKEQGRGEVDPETPEATSPTSRIYDSNGTRWIPDFGEGNEVPLTSAEENIPPDVLRNLATSGFFAIERLMMDEKGYGEWAQTLGRAFTEEVSNLGPARHKAWHRSRGIPNYRSHA